MSETDIQYSEEAGFLLDLRDRVRDETNPRLYAAHYMSLHDWLKGMPKDIAHWPTGVHDDYRQLKLDLDFLIRKHQQKGA